MCTAFSNIQNLNKAKRDPNVVAAEIEKARVHLKWCCHLQVDRGAYFLHEHPRLATSWHEPEITNLLRQEGIDKINADQCQLGKQTDSGDPLKKPTGFMSNASQPLSKLNRRCFGQHGICSRPQRGRHVECLSKKAQRAAIFQEELCMAILTGFTDQLGHDRGMRDGELSMFDIDGIMMDGTTR